MGIRIFTGQLNEENPLNRHVDNDAPVGLRHEFIDLAFNIFERAGDFDERRLHHIIVQSLGGFPSGQPYGGARRECSREIARVDWPRVYDLICRLWNELLPGSQEEYRAA